MPVSTPPFVLNYNAKGDLIIGTADNTASRLAVGSNNHVLIADSGEATGVKWGATPSTLLSVVSKTTTYTASISDDVILCSGSSFSVTLPTASGNSGKVFRIQKTDSSLSNSIIIDGNASETINGATTYTLYTQYEAVDIVSDGSNWIIINQLIPSAWTDSGAITLEGSTSNPTKGTMDRDKLFWMRRGNHVLLRYEFRQTGAGSAGTGVYLLGLPSGMTIDTSWLSTTNDTTSTISADVQTRAGGFGSGWISGGSSRGTSSFFVWSSTRLFVAAEVAFTGLNSWGQSGSYGLNAAGIAFAGTVELPIANWNG